MIIYNNNKYDKKVYKNSQQLIDNNGSNALVKKLFNENKNWDYNNDNR